MSEKIHEATFADTESGLNIMLYFTLNCRHKDGYKRIGWLCICLSVLWHSNRCSDAARPYVSWGYLGENQPDYFHDVLNYDIMKTGDKFALNLFFT